MTYRTEFECRAGVTIANTVVSFWRATLQIHSIGESSPGLKVNGRNEKFYSKIKSTLRHAGTTRPFRGVVVFAAAEPRIVFPASTMTPPVDGNLKKKQPKSLATLLRHFIGVQLSVELKNGKIIRGNLSASDGDMNLMLEDVESSLVGLGLPSSLQTVHIRGSTIRYIHFPDDLPLATTVKNSLALERSASGKYQRVVRRNTK